MAFWRCDRISPQSYDLFHARLVDEHALLSTVSRTAAGCVFHDWLPNGQTIRTIAWAADVRQDRTLPENGSAANRGRQKLRFQTLPIAELGTFRRLTLPEIPSSLLLMCPTYSLLDIRRSDSVLCRLAIVEF